VSESASVDDGFDSNMDVSRWKRRERLVGPDSPVERMSRSVRGRVDNDDQVEDVSRCDHEGGREKRSGLALCHPPYVKYSMQVGGSCPVSLSKPSLAQRIHGICL